MKLSALILTGGLALSANAFWRMECPGRVALARIDPLVSFGTASQHAHAIHGSSGFSETATYDDLMNGDCTSCRVKEDKSAYWHPAVFFEDAATGKFEVVNQRGGMLAYYLLFPNPGETKVRAFPKDFRMIAGDSTRRNYSEALGDVSKPDPEKSLWGMLGQTNQGALRERAVGFNCLNYNRQPEGTLFRHFMPDKAFLDANCANGLRFELMFPSCWNGKDLDSPNHRDHMAYPDLVMNGNCPKSHPVRLISMLYETIWNTYDFKDRAGRFVVANGDVNGFGYHGDFQMGWNENFLQQAADTCLNLSGRLEDCPLFTLQSEDESRQCKLKQMPKLLSTEDTTGPGLDALPGNVAIQLGPGPATNNNPPPATTSVQIPTPTYQPGTSATGASYLPGQVFHGQESASRLPGAQEVDNDNAQVESTEPPAPPSTTPPPPPPPAPEEVEDPNFKAVSTQYITAGNVVSKIVWAEEVVYVTEYEETTSTMTVTGTTTVRANSHARRHLRELRDHARHHF